MKRRIVAARHPVDERYDGHVVLLIRIRPGVSECYVQMIVSNARNIGGSGELHVGNAIGVARYPIGRPCSLQIVEYRVQRTVTNNVNMQREACLMKAPDEFPDDRGIVLQLPLRYAALRRMESMRCHKVSQGPRRRI